VNSARPNNALQLTSGGLLAGARTRLHQVAACS
jgi:hypothetical protein